MRLGPRRKPNLKRLGKRGDVEGLCEAAQYEELVPDRDGNLVDLGASVRIDAITRLDGLYGPEVEGTLAGRLADRDASVRAASAIALERVGSDRARAALVGFLASEPVRHDDPLRARLRAALTDAPVMGQAARWAEAAAAPGARPLDDGAEEDFRALLAADPAPQADQLVFREALPRLTGVALGDEGFQRYAQIMRWSRPLRLHGMAETLVAPGIEGPVVVLAGLTGDQQLVGPLAHVAQRVEPGLRLRAVEALGELHDTSAVIPLLRATRDDDYHVRRGALDAIDALGAAGITVAVTMLSQAALERRAAAGDSALAEAGDEWTERMLGRLLTKVTSDASEVPDERQLDTVAEFSSDEE